MASRISWFLGSLLALLFCYDAALAAMTSQEMDIKTLKNMKKVMTDPGQFAVMHLPGGSLKNCHGIEYDDARGVDGNCNFAKVFDKQLNGDEETFRHAEWQLINTALGPMLQKWQNKQTNCPSKLYLYTYLAPDYIRSRRPSKRTCTQAIVETIPQILDGAKCAQQTKTVVGFTVIDSNHTDTVCEGYQLMEGSGITVYHLRSNLPDYRPDCGVEAGRQAPPQPGPSKPVQRNAKPGKSANMKG